MKSLPPTGNPEVNAEDGLSTTLARSRLLGDHGRIRRISPKPFLDGFLLADKAGTDRVGEHLGVYRDQFGKWMDGLTE